MENLYLKVLRYNVINIGASLILLPLQLLNLTIWQKMYYHWLSDSDFISVVLFWPLILLISIVVINMKNIRRFIHKSNEYIYAANNINIDEEEDKGSLSNDVYNELPTSKFRTTKLITKCDVTFWGTLDDIGINYIINDLNYDLRYSFGDDYSYALEFRGQALDLIFNESIFGDEWILYEKNLRIQRKMYKQKYTYKSKSNSKIVLHSNQDFTMKKDIVAGIEAFLEYNKEIFQEKRKVIALFKGDNLILIIDKNHKFKIRIPFVLTESKLEKIIYDQKGQVYRFNQFLVEMSRSIYQYRDSLK